MESKEGLVLAVSTIKASSHDSSYVQVLLNKVALQRPLSPTAKRFNKLVAKRRYKVERLFGSIDKLVP
ncbi:hypothetical protein DK880_00016 [Candidatus Cardinium hertigii]|uniref:Transposase IS4-like domain-containing protein n=1 Tax=Candidatus Cardinium hertigii TaxID=247481 RepID=A0A2Z3L7D7_9BACT|nr:hypothetical protein DK880_00016 [Candidatus Cardinium hertigii]